MNDPYFFFGDDTRQKKPSRSGLGKMWGAGGFLVKSSRLYSLENRIEALCKNYSFPEGSVFKWSPGKKEREIFFRGFEQREEFYFKLFDIARKHEIRPIFASLDIDNAEQNGYQDHNTFITKLILERIQQTLNNFDSVSVVFAEPSGGSIEENSFLAESYNTLRKGTHYVRMSRIIMVLTSPFEFVRSLQLADIISSCSMARLCGERKYSPSVFKLYKDLFPVHLSTRRRGGWSFKILPNEYANLYHFLLGDSVSSVEGGTKLRTIPTSELPFFEGLKNE